MTIHNTLLIQYKYGFTEVADAASIALYGRQKGFLALGDVETVAEAQRLGNAELSRVAQPRTEVSIGAPPETTATARPFVHYDVGDYVLLAYGGSYRVREIPIAENVHGDLKPVMVKLNSRLEEQDIRVERLMSRMTPGTFSGTSMVATPIETPKTILARRANTTSQTFSWHGTPNSQISSPWTPEVYGRLAQCHLRLSTVDTVNTTVDITVDGVTVSTGTITAGQESGWAFVNVPFGPLNKCQLQVTSTNVNGSGLTARLTQVHYFTDDNRLAF